MRELRRCDFCADDAVGAFEIVPSELEPTEAEQRRVVCCPDCRDRLETLLEPLLARAGAETDADAETDIGDAESSGASVDDSTADESVLATADDSTATRSRTASSNAAVSEEAASPSDDPDAVEAEPTRAEDESDAVASLAEGITFERDEHATDEATAAGAEPAADTETAVDTETANGETVAADPTAVTETADVPNGDEAESAADSDDGDSTPASTRPPATYGKVIRLLRNREFPMERRDVEGLAAGAYDLESHEVEAIIDYAVEYGEFVEKRGTLRRP